MDPIAHVLGDWASSPEWYTVLFRIVLSAVFAAIIGWERSSKRHSAGLRTFIIISLAGTVAMLLDKLLAGVTGSGLFLLSVAAIIGMAIISVNSILFSAGGQIKGLTTTAALWANGLIGIAVGAGYYTVALFAFAALLAGISLFPTIEVYLKNRSNHFEVHLELNQSSRLADFVATIRKLGLRIDDIEINTAYANSGLSVYTVALSIVSPELKKYKTHTEIIEALSSLDYVSHIEELLN